MKNKVELRPQDGLIQGDITKLPFAPDKLFDVMYGDFILSCFHPKNIADFFSSVSMHLNQNDGTMFLSLSCNHRAQNYNMKEIPFAFDFMIREEKGQELYFKAPLSFYQRLAENQGLEFKIIKQQIRDKYPDICDYYLAIEKRAKNVEQSLKSD